MPTASPCRHRKAYGSGGREKINVRHPCCTAAVLALHRDVPSAAQTLSSPRQTRDFISQQTYYKVRNSWQEPPPPLRRTSPIMQQVQEQRPGRFGKFIDIADERQCTGPVTVATEKMRLPLPRRPPRILRPSSSCYTSGASATHCSYHCCCYCYYDDDDDDDDD